MDQTSRMPLPTGRIVVQVEMEDGTLQALDGEGHGLIEVRTHLDDQYEPDVFGLQITGRTTTVKITYPGQLTMYHSKHPQAPNVDEIEPWAKKVADHD